MLINLWHKHLSVQLIAYFLLFILTSIAIVGGMSYWQGREALQQATIRQLQTTAAIKEQQIDSWLSTQVRLVQILARISRLQIAVEDLLGRSNTSALQSRAVIEDQISLLEQQASDWLEVSITDAVNGKVIYTNFKESEGGFYTTDIFFINGRNKTYLKNVYYSAKLQQSTITIATPLQSQSSQQLIAVLIVHLNLDVLEAILLENTGLGETGETYLVDQYNDFVSQARAMPNKFLRGVHTQGIDAALSGQNGSGFYDNYRAIPVIGVYRWLEKYEMALIAEVEQSQALVPVETLGQTIMFISLVVLILLGAIVYQISRQISHPILAIAETATKVTAGDLQQQATVLTRNEIATMAQAFNTMTERLRDLIDNLESRVRDRTERLQVITELSGQLSAMLDLDKLLSLLVNKLQVSFDYYYVQVYLLDEEREVLVMVEGSGAIGQTLKQQHHHLNKGQGIVGTVAVKNQPFLSNDVRLTATYLVNPLLPNTKSELAFPLRTSEKVIGVLDVQHEITDAFSAEDMALFQTIADQTAIAINNARLLTERQETIVKLQEVDKAKSQFIAMMSHELRTPLNVINGFVELLLFGLSGELSEQAQADVKLIHKNGQHLITLINEILDISQIETGQIQLHQKPLSVTPIIENVVAESQSLLQDKPLTITVDIAPTLPDLYADPIRLKQILLNLLNNAIKFTLQGQITIQAKKQGEQICLTVIDTGIGIPFDKQGIIFEAFQQGDMSTSRLYQGTGLGLSISKRLVNLHGGEMGVKSEQGEGAEFWFTMPIVG